MLSHKDHFHGSDLEKIEELFGIKKEKITSFSSNVNPLGLPESVKNAFSSFLSALTAYPDRNYKALREAVAAYSHCDSASVLVGNGSSELISLFISALSPKKALILGPTYSEYERSVALAGGKSRYFPLREKDGFRLNEEALEEKLTEDTDLFILCNPNNPTAGLIRRDTLRRILDICMERAIFVMVDETYIEFTDHMDSHSAIALTGDYENLVVLRGISKFYAAPGLRFGYAVTKSSRLLLAFHSGEIPWSVNSMAEKMVPLMLSDTDFQAKTRELIRTERNRLTEVYQSSGKFTVYPSDANFLMMKIREENVTSEDLFLRCIRQGLMIRDCSSFPFLSEKFIRICLLMPEENDRLSAVLLT